MSVDPASFLPGAYSQRVPQGGSANLAIPDTVPAFIGLSRGKTTLVESEAVSRGTLNGTDALANTDIRRIIKISNTDGGPADYTLDSQYELTGDTVDWSPTVKLSPPALDTPTLGSGATGTWGSTGAKYFVISALNGNGETLQSNEVSITLTATTQEVVLTWSRVPNATSYKIFQSNSQGTYGGTSLLTTIASGATTTYTAIIEASTAGSPAGSNTADDEPTASSATYYVTYEYADFTAMGTAKRYTDLSVVFADHGIGSQIGQMAELAMSTQTSRGNRAPAVWLVGVENGTSPEYQAGLTALEAVRDEVLIVVMDKKSVVLDQDLRNHVADMNGVEVRRERVGMTWNAPGTAIGDSSTSGTIVYDAAQSVSFDMFHVAVDSGTATALLASTSGTYAAATAQGYHVAAIVAGMGAALPDAATPWTRKPVTGLVNMSGTEWTETQLKTLRDGGVIVVDNVSGDWRVLEGTTTLRTGEQEEKYVNISLADKTLAQLWRNTIDPASQDVYNRRSLIGEKISDALLDQVKARTKDALDRALQRGLIRSYDENSITVVQNVDTKTQIDVSFSYVAFFPALTIISNRTFDLNQTG